MFLSAVSLSVVAQSSSEIPEGLMNNPVCKCIERKAKFVSMSFSKNTGDTCGRNRTNWPHFVAIVMKFRSIYLHFCNISNATQLFLFLFYNAFNLRVVMIVCLDI